MQTISDNGITPLAAAIAARQLSGRKLNALCEQYGITRARLGDYAAGRARPAPWLARELAATFGLTVEDLMGGAA